MKGFFELLRKSLDDVLVYGELVLPKLYAFVLVFGLLALSNIVSGVFFSVSEPVGVMVFVVLAFLSLLVGALLFLGADLVIVEMMSSLRRGEVINKSFCMDCALNDLGEYLAVLVPIGVGKMLVSLLLSVPLVFSGLSLDWVEVSVQLLYYLIELFFAVFFILLPQVVVLESKGFWGVLRTCLGRGVSRFWLMLRYVVLRFLTDFILQLVLALLLAVLLTPVASEVVLLFEQGDLSVLYGLTGVLLSLVVLIYVVARFLFSAFFIVLDTNWYFELFSED